MAKTKRDLTPWHRAYEKMQANYTGQWSEITIQDFIDNWAAPEIEQHKRTVEKLRKESSANKKQAIPL